MSSRAAVVLTYKSVHHLLEDGGTQSWRMHRSRLKSFEYVICTRNASHADVEGDEPHRSAFLVAKVKSVVPSTDQDPADVISGAEKPRFLVLFDEVAILPKPIQDFWRWGRWPVHFDDLEALGIDIAALDFQPLAELRESLAVGPEATKESIGAGQSAPPSGGWREAIGDAKLALGARLGVDPSAIEITVRV